MFFKCILLMLPFLLNCLDAMAFDGPSQNQKTALLDAKKSKQINVALLRTEDRREWITLIGHSNEILGEDARIIGEIVKKTLEADNSCILSAACTSLSKGLTHVISHSRENSSKVKNIEAAGSYLSPQTIKNVDKLLGFVADSAIHFSKLLTVYDVVSTVDIMFNDYPDLRRTFRGCHTSADQRFYGPACVDGQMDLIHEALAAQHREQQEALASWQTHHHHMFLNFYSVLGCFVAQGARSTLRWIYPHAATTTSDDITKAIVNLLRPEKTRQVIALVPWDNFDTIKEQLQALYFEEVDPSEIVAKEEETACGK